MGVIIGPSRRWAEYQRHRGRPGMRASGALPDPPPSCPAAARQDARIQTTQLSSNCCPTQHPVKIPSRFPRAAILTVTLNSATRWERDGAPAPLPSSSSSSEASPSRRALGGGIGVGSRGGWGGSTGDGGG